MLSRIIDYVASFVKYYAEGRKSCIINSFGLTIPLRLNPYLLLLPSLEIYGTNYGFEPGDVKAVPVEIEYASGAWVMAFLLDTAVAFDISLSEQANFGIFAAPAFLFRLPLFPWPEEESSDLTTRLVEYLYGSGRFFYPEVGIYFHYKLFESIALKIQARALFPLFHAWDEEGVEFHDQFVVLGSIGFRFLLSNEQVPDSQESDSQEPESQ